MNQTKQKLQLVTPNNCKCCKFGEWFPFENFLGRNYNKCQMGKMKAEKNISEKGN